MSHAIHLGLAIGARRISACWVDSRGAERRWSTEIDEGTSLSGALGELTSVMGDSARVSATVALLPSLCRARRVSLPPMSSADRAAAVTRAAHRHFLGLAEPVAVAAASRGEMVSAASEETISTIQLAIAALRWRIERMVPAHAAWCVAAMRRWPALRRGTHAVVVAGDDEWTTLMMEGGTLSLVRRGREPLSIGSPLVLADNPATAAAEAAAFAGFVTDIELVDAAETARRGASAGRIARWLTAAAAVILLAAAGVYHFGLVRERDSIVAERAALHSRVGAAMTQRDSLARLVAAITAVDRLEQAAPRWSAVIARAAAAMPARSSLVSIRAEGDSARLDGEAEDAMSVFSRLQRAPGLVSIRPSGAIRQETGADARTVEHWTVSTRVDHRRAVRGDR